MILKKLFFSIFILTNLYLMGCTTVQIPAGTMLSPEVSERAVEIGMASQQSRIIYMSQTSDINNKSISTMDGGSFRGDAYLSSYLAVNFFKSISVVNEPGGYRLQWQLFGEGRQTAKPGNISFSVFGGTNTYKSSSSSIDLANPAKKLVTSSSSVAASYSVQSPIAGIIIGYRTSDKAVLGLLLYQQQFNITAKGTLADTSSGTLVSQDNTEIRNSYTDSGIGLPLFLGGDTFAIQFTPTMVFMKEPILQTQVHYTLINMKMTWSF